MAGLCAEGEGKVSDKMVVCVNLYVYTSGGVVAVSMQGKKPQYVFLDCDRQSYQPCDATMQCLGSIACSSVYPPIHVPPCTSVSSLPLD